ncbi:uncharacterized protein [Triticum aestivum]|uniref:uncharacterized protein isoform X2 n=1 Tax=Triticum aestivum TaxID=4565 RepID=UPI001D01F16B|nr:uncharacterized protein LOC123183037 isoform X2 [Triticum aestivum]
MKCVLDFHIPVLNEMPRHRDRDPNSAIPFSSEALGLFRCSRKGVTLLLKRQSFFSPREERIPCSLKSEHFLMHQLGQNVSYLQVMILLQLAAWVYSELAAAVPLVSLEDTDDRNAAMGSVNYHLDLADPLTSRSPVVSFCLRRWIAYSAPFVCRGNA